MYPSYRPPVCRSKCNIQPVCMGGNWNSGGGNSFVCGQNGGGGGYGYNPGYNPGYNSGYNPGYNQVLSSVLSSSLIFLLARAVTVDVVECREEPVEELLLPLMFSSPPGLVRRRRRCRPPTLPWSLNKLTNTGSVSPSQTFFQKQFYGKFSVKYIYLLIK